MGDSLPAPRGRPVSQPARLSCPRDDGHAGHRGGTMTRTEEFEDLRPLLFSIAYRILGSVSEAEDAVQETWLRYETSPTRPLSPKAFLSTIVTRVSLNVLRSARVRREQYVGEWFPERSEQRRRGEVCRSGWRTRLRIVERDSTCT